MDTIVNYVVSLCVNFFDLYIIYRYMTIFFDNHYIDKKLTVVAYMTRFVLSIVLGSVVLYPLTSIIISLACIFLIALCYSANFSKKIIVTIVVYMCGFIAEAIVALLVGLSDFEPFGQIVQASALSEVIIEIIFWAITLGVQRFQNVSKNTSIHKTFIIAIVIIPLSSVYLELMIFQQKNIESGIAGISLVCVLAMNFILIYLYDSLSVMFQERTQAAIVLREKDYYHEQSEMLKRKHEELRQFRHDMENRIIVMQQMLKDREYDTAMEYTEQISEKLSQTEVYSITGNTAIDSVLNYKLTKASEKGIKIESNVAIPEKIGIDEEDIVVILGNLLDNAIEATEKLKEDKYISIDLEYDKGSVFIHVKNSYDSLIRFVNGKIVTRKKDEYLHGIGLQSVNTVVEKYNGLLDIEHNNREFIVNILLYM
ncbi:MAG: GHKL domain-containing protein [Lachnospiraceae bacterium]|nr:GHKL domain-containing protein [Lachnospiraceae bacterium]